MALKLRKPFKIIICFLVGILGLILFLLLIGFIVDCFTYPLLKRQGNEALEYLMSLRRDELGNAWDFYSIAIEKSKDIEYDELRLRYLRGEIEITPNIIKAIEDNEDVIEKIKKGAKQDFCSIPYNFEKGIDRNISNYLRLREIIRITCLRSLRKFENAQPEEALNDIFSVVTVGKHIASGGPTWIDQMMGAIYIAIALDVLKIGLASGIFNNSELEIISRSLNELERDWPMHSSALDVENKMMKISIANVPFYKPFEPIFYKYAHVKNLKKNIIGKVLLRLSCWRYLFSPRFASLRGLKFMESIVLEMQKIEHESIEVLRKEEKKTNIEDVLQVSINNYVKTNPIFNLWYANVLFFSDNVNISSIYRRRLENITKTRILHLSCLVSSYHLKNGKYPLNLEEIGSDIVIDFNTGEMWEYTNYGDSVTILSPGPSVTDTSDNITITLTKMGIKKSCQGP